MALNTSSFPIPNEESFSYGNDGESFLYNATGVSDKAELDHFPMYPTVTVTPGQALIERSELEEVEQTEELQQIGHDAFQGCSPLTNIKFPDTNEGLRQIGHDAFKDCSSLKHVHFPDTNEGLQQIPHDAFKGCPPLTRIEIPDTNWGGD